MGTLYRADRQGRSVRQNALRQRAKAQAPAVMERCLRIEPQMTAKGFGLIRAEARPSASPAAADQPGMTGAAPDRPSLCLLRVATWLAPAIPARGSPAAPRGGPSAAASRKDAPPA